jgi:Cys-tRNA(Pro)/Cys-tRNA(Cys) deacylase
MHDGEDPGHRGGRLSGKGTPATKALERAQVPVRVLTYAHDPKHESFGLEAVQALDLDPATVFKTLVAQVDGRLTVAIVPVERQLDLKALAAATHSKKAQMANVQDAERATGYVAGGISPLGQRKPLPTVLDDTALNHPAIHVSGGRRGLELELAPDDLQRLTNATVAPISGSPRR